MAAGKGGAAVVMEGTLTKRSIGKTLVPNWKKRHFRLYYYGKIAYYVNDASTKAKEGSSEDRFAQATPKGSLVLTWDMQVRAVTSRSNCFAVKSPTIEVVLQASSPALMAEWMQALQRVIDASVQGSDQSQTRFVV